MQGVLEYRMGQQAKKEFNDAGNDHHKMEPEKLNLLMAMMEAGSG